MAPTDVDMRDSVIKFIIPISAGVIIAGIYFAQLSKWVRDKFFGGTLTSLNSLYELKIKDVRRKLLHDLDRLESKVPVLRNKGVLRILEIGAGSGKNLKFYPQQSRVILVDPSPHFLDYFTENRHQFPDICIEDFLVTGPERMTGVPDNSVDVVVATLVLCSVNDVRATLNEVRRVLVQGGRFYFLEHIGESFEQKLWKWQKWLTKLNLWPWMFNGCHLDRDTDNLIAQAGFLSIHAKRFHIKCEESKALKMMSLHIMGYAVK